MWKAPRVWVLRPICIAQTYGYGEATPMKLAEAQLRNTFFLCLTSRRLCAGIQAALGRWVSQGPPTYLT